MSEQPIEKASINTLASELFEIRKLITAREGRKDRAAMLYLICGAALIGVFFIGMLIDQTAREQGGASGYASGYALMLGVVLMIVGAAKHIER